MSRFRLNPALVLGAMVNGTIDKNVNEETGSMLRPTNLQPVYGQNPISHCKQTFCRTGSTCECTCRRCVDIRHIEKKVKDQTESVESIRRDGSDEG